MGNTPNVRFKGFTEDWEQRKVSEIGNIITGSTPKTSISDNYGGEFLFVSPADIQGNRYVDETITTLTKKGFDQGRKIRKRASLFVSIGSTIGKVAQTSQESTTNQQINAVEPYDNFDDDFIFTSLENISGSIKAIASNQAVPIVNKTTFGETEIQVPSELEEQQKIGAYFRNLDHLITLHQQKCDETKEFKKYMLQNMFPQKDEKVPKIRFDGFTGDWEQRKLKEIANKVSEKNKNNEFSEPFTNSAEQGIISQKDYFDREIVNNENLDGYYIVRNDDFIYNPRISVTAPVGPINRNRLGRNGVMSPLYTVFRTHDIDNLYLEFYFKTTKWHRFMKLNGDSGARFDRFTISSTQFMEMPIPYPTLDEQQKIGKYFDSLDRLITLHQQKCNALKEFKKYMLQNMFPQKGENKCQN
mgnify:CR=1 FL=1